MLKPQELIKVAVCNAAQLLSGKRIKTENQTYIRGQLSIPEYQHSYVWGQNQIDKLINDLKDHKDQFSDTSYYLGSVTLHLQDGHLNIIDGQQRY
ncbi:GmrSD restriction endonuclease domain-containing protein [Acinetobacter sp. ANC 4193]